MATDRIVSVVNALFWGWLWADVSCNLEPFADRPATFEEVLPLYKFGGEAISPVAEHSMVSLKAVQTIQQPSYSLVVMIANRLSHQSWEQRLGSWSVGSVVLVAAMLTSFLQWGIVALLVEHLLPRQTLTGSS